MLKHRQLSIEIRHAPVLALDRHVPANLFGSRWKIDNCSCGKVSLQCCSHSSAFANVPAPRLISLFTFQRIPPPTSGCLIFESAHKPAVTLGVDDFASQTSPRLQYYLGRMLDALGRTSGARRAYEAGITGVELLFGDRDSWNSENFFMVSSLERLGRSSEAARLEERLADFARGEIDARNARYSDEARYLLGLVRLHGGRQDEGSHWLQKSLDAQPDLIQAPLSCGTIRWRRFRRNPTDPGDVLAARGKRLVKYFTVRSESGRLVLWRWVDGNRNNRGYG